MSQILIKKSNQYLFDSIIRIVSLTVVIIAVFYYVLISA
jgi:hypothetical protein